jgi:glycerol-1-phosphate dehydrogenase [NAD(P)+]
MSQAAHLPVYIGPNAVTELLAYCQAHGLEKFTLVLDANTYTALGQAAEAALKSQGYDVLTIKLAGDDIAADARYVTDVLLALDRMPRTYIAVGSGTLTDITRFVSHRTGREFISLPTAPSVDGYTSVGAPMVLHGAKVTVNCHGPLAVFADLPTLCAAPRPMLAAGFGDMLAKLTSVADWELGALLWDEPWDAEIARRSRAAAWACVQSVDSTAAAECEGVKALMDGLIESGFCMLDFGGTRPASGAEHHMSHLWEMLFLRQGRHSVLHGAKVGVAVVLSLQRYASIRGTTRAAAEARLAASKLPDRAAAVAGIWQAFGPLADEVIAGQRPFLDMTEERYAALKQRVLGQWDDIQRIAGEVPTPEQMTGWLRMVGGPVTGREIGLSDQEVDLGLRYGHYYRERFTSAKLVQILGLEPAA